MIQSSMNKILLALVLTVSFTYAQTLSFPADKPVLMVDFPQTWGVELDKEEVAGVIAMSADETVEINLWMLDQTKVDKNPDKAIETAINDISTLINDNITDFNITKQENGEIDGIKYISIEGKGIDNETKKETQVYAEILTPNEKNIFVMLYWASEDAESKNKKDIDHVFESIQKVK